MVAQNTSEVFTSYDTMARVLPSSRPSKKHPRRQKGLTILSTVVLVSCVVLFRVISLRQQVSLDHISLSTSSSNTLHSKENHKNTSSPLKCNNHGNCPANTDCENGTCLPFLLPTVPANSKFPKQDQQCVQSCLNELIKDEYFYHGTEPKVVKSYPSRTPNRGLPVASKDMCIPPALLTAFSFPMLNVRWILNVLLLQVVPWAIINTIKQA
jgi:hypothetical protein